MKYGTETDTMTARLALMTVSLAIRENHFRARMLE